MASKFVQHPAFEEPTAVPVNALVGPTPIGLEQVQAQQPPAPGVEQRTDNPPAPTAESIAASKYGDDINALRQGYDSQFREVQENLIPQMRAIQDQNKLLMERFLSQPVAPTAPVSDPDMDALATLGIPVDALQRVVDRIADQKAQARLEPIARFARAQTEIASEIPGYSEVAPHIQRFLSGRPDLEREVNEIAQLNPKAAAKYAFREYEASKPRASAADGGLNRTNAAIPTSNTMGSRMHAERDFQRELAEAKEFAAQTGDERPYWRVFNEMSGSISHPSFSQPAQ